VNPPAKNALGVSAIATVSMSGDITGVDADNQASVVSLLVGTHSISKTLTGSDTRKQIAEFFLVELRNRGVDAVLDRESGLLIIVLTDSNAGLGVGSTDLGIQISGSTMTEKWVEKRCQFALSFSLRLRPLQQGLVSRSV